MVLNKSCPICFGDDFKAEEMSYIPSCGHQFCLECMKKHIEVRLSEGSVLRCPHYQCQSSLVFESFANFLTPQVRAMWEQRIKEELIPITERIYCPDPRCSALMSKTELSKSNNGVRSCCVKCGQLFSINCNVPWHKKLWCDSYKISMNPNPNDREFKALANQKRWRQCRNCKHMIERYGGCKHITCRCGYTFCYTCGAEVKGVLACRHDVFIAFLALFCCVY